MNDGPAFAQCGESPTPRRNKLIGAFCFLFSITVLFSVCYTLEVFRMQARQAAHLTK